jgi:hypothetical protein
VKLHGFGKDDDTIARELNLQAILGIMSENNPPKQLIRQWACK